MKVYEMCKDFYNDIFTTLCRLENEHQNPKTEWKGKITLDMLSYDSKKGKH